MVVVSLTLKAERVPECNDANTPTCTTGHDGQRALLHCK